MNTLSAFPKQNLTPEEVEQQNDGFEPEFDTDYVCGNCGATDGAEHPLYAHCWYCGEDDWEPKDPELCR